MVDSLINGLLTTLIKVVLALIKFISNIILLPLTAIMRVIVPDLSSYTTMANNFINNYVLKAIAVGREIFLNFTGFPQSLLTISVTIALTMLTYIGTVRTIAFVRNMWRTFKGG